MPDIQPLLSIVFASPHISAHHTGLLSYSFNFSASTLCCCMGQPNFWKALLTLALLFQASLERQFQEFGGKEDKVSRHPLRCFRDRWFSPTCVAICIMKQWC